MISAFLRFVLLASERPGLKSPLSVHYAMVVVAPKVAAGICGDCVVIVVEVVVEAVWKVSCG